MSKLPNLEDIETVSENEIFSVEGHLDNTEQVLKRLMINIQAFKKIEQENKKLKQMILENQKLIKQDFKKKLEEVAQTSKGKKDVVKKNQQILVKQFKVFIEKLNRKIIREIEKNNLLRKKYYEIYQIAKKLYHDNTKIKITLLKNNGVLRKKFEDKFKEIKTSLVDKQKVSDGRHKTLLKKHEEIKLELNKKLVLEKSRNVTIEKKYKELVNASEKILEDNKKLQTMNKKMLHALSYFEKRSVANQKVLEGQAKLIRKDFENKLKKITKLQLNKEIEYKTRIDSLTKDLEKYYDELRKSKQKYYLREKELKEKLKDILSK